MSLGNIGKHWKTLEYHMESYLEWEKSLAYLPKNVPIHSYTCIMHTMIWYGGYYWDNEMGYFSRYIRIFMDLPSGAIKHSWLENPFFLMEIKRAGKIIKQNGRLMLMTGEESWIPYYHGKTWENVWEHVKKKRFARVTGRINSFKMI